MQLIILSACSREVGDLLSVFSRRKRTNDITPAMTLHPAYPTFFGASQRHH